MLQGLPSDERLAALPFGGSANAELLAPGWVTRADRELASGWLDALSELEPRGKTDLGSALQGAHERLAPFGEARRRLLVLLTDGDPDHAHTAESFREVARACDVAKIDRLALVVGDRGAWTALRDGFVGRPQDALLLEGSDRLEDRLRAALAARRLEQERLQHPAGYALEGPFDAPPWRPRALHALEVAENAEVMLTARDPSPDAGTFWPFLARRGFGAGEVFATSWGPALEAAGSPALAPGRKALVSWIVRAADESRRGLEGVWVGPEIHIAAPALAGEGTLRWRTPDTEGVLVEHEPGVFSGALPAAETEAVWIEPVGRAALPVRLPARPAAEHRGVGIDDVALEALVTAGGGVRLAPGERIPARGRGPGIPLAPWMLGLAAILLVMERAWRPGRELSDP